MNPNNPNDPIVSPPNNPNDPIVSPPVQPPEEPDTETAPSAASPGDWRVILLGIYLLILLFAGLFVLAKLMMAQPSKSDGNSNTNSNTAANVSNKNSTTPSRNVNATANVTPNTNTTPNANTTPDTNTETNTTAETNSSNSAANDNTDSTKKEGGKPPTTIPEKVDVSFFGDLRTLTSDGYVFWVVFFAGMMGALIRCVFSYIRHLGIGDFSLNWAAFYMLLPFSGAILSVILYFVIRGGFYSSSLGDELSLNLFSFAALGALTGLFSENAMEKLKEVAESLLTKVEPKSSETTRNNNNENE